MEIVFWASVLLLVHSYLFYPLILKILSIRIKNRPDYLADDTNMPFISILISVFNEEEVIEEKILSIVTSDFPVNNFEIIIGSDNSTDNTNEILKKLQEQYKCIQFFIFDKRQGKPNVINQLALKAKGEILILTDANVIFDKSTIHELVKPFHQKDIGLVDSHMINKGMSSNGISIQENAYISREVQIKNMESRLWGTMMGPFGGCFALRKELYETVPGNFLVDDFFLNMTVLSKKMKSVNNLSSKVFEDVSNNLKDEFKRKIRIATGNFQNLVHFRKLLFPLTSGLSFSFLSHKVLRWLGPFFLIVILTSNMLLIQNQFYFITLLCYIVTLFIPIIDLALRKINIHIIPLRFITHFYSMNLALLVGFFKYLKGVKSNVWQPTQRNQSEKNSIKLN